MPNKGTHVVIAAGTGVTLDLLLQYFSHRLDNIGRPPEMRTPFEPNWAEVGVVGLACVGGALMPDGMEPATDPNHRAVCHSVLAGAVVAIPVACKFQEMKENGCRELLPRAALAFGVGYLTHLGADALTPKGLPLVGVRPARSRRLRRRNSD
ncbi:MAG: metal-dependent hydrolase [Verrucomicrobiota bacterium]